MAVAENDTDSLYCYESDTGTLIDCSDSENEWPPDSHLMDEAVRFLEFDFGESEPSPGMWKKVSSCLQDSDSETESEPDPFPAEVSHDIPRYLQQFDSHSGRSSPAPKRKCLVPSLPTLPLEGFSLFNPIDLTCVC